VTGPPLRRWASRLRRRLTPDESAPGARADDARLVAGLRAGDEAVFSELMDRYGDAMVKVALMYVATRALAEEVVQETWIAVLRGIDGFEGRAALRTWIFRILVNRARSAAIGESRSVPFSALGDEGPTVDPDRFLEDGRWASPPVRWSDHPERRALAAELREHLRAALEQLAPAQRAVVTLRDLHGFSAADVCGLLEITPGNQRVLLHRGRARLRALIEAYLRPEV
jgi:RNA polymerase sigma-70 factor (ECF subfamily)